MSARSPSERVTLVTRWRYSHHVIAAIRAGAEADR
jgi:hypothetical protein